MTMHEAFTSTAAKRIAATSIFCACLTGGIFLVKADAQNAPNSAPNYGVEGDWVRVDMNHSGSFDGLNEYVTPADLTPEGKALAATGRGRGLVLQGGVDVSPRPNLDAPEDAPHKPGEPYVVHAQAMCANTGNGANSFQPDSGGFHIIVARSQVVFSEERGGSRIIYMDGRPQPDEADNPHPTYHSVGHWENGELVVDTVGRVGGRGTPGGGVIAKTTHLTERFQVGADGRHMKIVYTYWDPKYYVKPLSYTYTFDRAPNPPTYAYEEWCDISDPKEAQSIVPPEQK